MAKRQIRDYVFTPGVSGSGIIKVLDKIQLNQILLITNTTDNKLLYNFSDPANKITVSFTETTDGSDPDFPYANTNSNGVTTITLLFDTSDQSSTDSLQIFIEEHEVKFRPYDFGTDAIERMRVATPQSMLDADFEYGLQPTKWQTIDIMRGYPSLYEIPGSDLVVTNVTTNASSATSGIGDSLITVTTAENHGFSAGSAIRIIGLLDTVSGSPRAEGSFIVHDVISSTSFSYYAKGKVGTSNGQSLFFSTVQLRKAGFYTGASIGTPTFSIQSQGSSGIFTNNLGIRTDSNRISSTGISSVVTGAYLTGTGISTGTQVTGVTGLSTTKTLALDAIAPTNTITVNANTNGIEVGSAVDDGSGNASYVTNIIGNTITLSNPIVNNRLGSNDTIGIITANSFKFGFGYGRDAQFKVERDTGRYNVSLSSIEKTVTGTSGSTYLDTGNLTFLSNGQSVIGNGIGVGATIVGIASTTTVILSVPNSSTVSGIATFNNIGIGYSVNDRLVINGNSLGGESPLNDLIIRVDSVNGVGGITSFTSNKLVSVSGEAQLSSAQFKKGTKSLLLNPTSGSVDYLGISSHVDFNFSSGSFTVDFWIYRNRTSTTEYLYDMRTSTNEISPLIYINSSNYAVYFINGSAVITGITTLTASTWHHIAISKDSTTNTTRLFVDGNLDGSYTDNNTYSQKPIKIGARFDGVFGFYGYVDDFRISKGISRFISTFTPSESPFTFNDSYNTLLLRFEGSSGSSIISDSAYGLAIDSSGTYGVSGVTTGNGIGAFFAVEKTGGSTPSYNVTNNIVGSNYSIGDFISVDGSLLGGIGIVNDLTIEITNVGVGGEISSFDYVGTASSGNSVYNVNIPQNSGTDAQFIISKSDNSYNIGFANLGKGYYPGYKFLIPGYQLGGDSGNNLTITVDRLGTEPTDNIIGQLASVSGVGTAVVGSAVTFYPSVTISEPVTTLISTGSTITFSSLARIDVTFDSNHGLVPGDTALVSIASSGSNHALASGPRIVDEIPALNRIVYTARSAGTIVGAGLTGFVYARPDCFYVHRPFDGGVQLGTGGPAHGAHAIRQSKKYIRYQSGKGIMYTTGTLFAPGYDIRSVTASGTSVGSVITVVTDDTDHGLQIGAEISLEDIITSGYDGYYTVNGIINETTFTILATQTLGSTTAELGIQAQVSLYRWKGAIVRCGAFDDQNGIFWQYDGINLAVGLRSATYQLAGTIAVNANSNAITGTNTRFREQLIVGNRIVIRGMTHVVTNIQDNTTMTVTPDFRGVSNVSGVKATLVNEIIIPQYQWNIDKADGTGSSGYQIKVNKMQMLGFQYTWYGAGFIDWMLRGPNGDYLFVHRLKNNNRNTEAFMRSGNLPVRYEVINEGAKTKLVSNVGIASTSLTLADASLYPTSGTVYIDNEIINYTGKTSNTLTGLTRAATFTNFASGSQRSYTAGIASSHTANTGVVFLSNTATPQISHWGSAFLTDGLFDSDRGYIFNYQSVGVAVSTTKNTAFLIRLAPSVSNALTGDLGERELINRAQLLLQSIEFTPTGGSSNQGVVVEGILNPQNYPTNPANINWFSLTNAGVGGQPSFAQIANGSSVAWSGSGTVTASNALTQPFTNYVAFSLASTVDVKIGMQISGPGVPGGTLVAGIFPNPIHRFIQFSQPVNPGNAGSTTYTFTTIATAAVPGETVFSFVGNGGGGNNAALDLTQLKELNNTPLGGRGTFPNGPDVLAINVYTTSGSQFTGSLVLRWGEAQA